VVDESGKFRCRGDKLVQHLQALCSELSGQEIHASNVAAWPVETGDKPHLNRVATDSEDDRYGSRRRLGCQERRLAARGMGAGFGPSDS
jgi:hypothetical protein